MPVLSLSLLDSRRPVKDRLKNNRHSLDLLVTFVHRGLRIAATFGRAPR